MTCLIVLAFAACDPMRTIAVSNRLPDPVTVKFKMKECPSSIFSGDHTKEALDKVELGPLGDEGLAIIPYSFGRWWKTDIDSLAGCIDSVEIYNVRTTELTFITGAGVRQLLPKKRNWFGSEIKIKIEDK